MTPQKPRSLVKSPYRLRNETTERCFTYLLTERERIFNCCTCILHKWNSFWNMSCNFYLCLCSVEDLVTFWVSCTSFLRPVESLVSWSQAPCSEARRNAHVSWGMLCGAEACNTMCMKEAAVAAKISALRKISMISDVLFISFVFLKFWLTKTGLVVLVLSMEEAWSLKSYSWYLDFTKAPRDSCQAVLTAMSSWRKIVCAVSSLRQNTPAFDS